MVTHLGRSKRGGGIGGWLMAEMVVAMGLVVFLVLPLACSFLAEMKLCRAYYYRAAAMGVVDGEMEMLAAGEIQRYGVGKHPYSVDSVAARQLPGRLVLTVETNRMVLEWLPERGARGGGVRREAPLR